MVSLELPKLMVYFCGPVLGDSDLANGDRHHHDFISLIPQWTKN
ncbi:MAG: hypothetical protein ACO36E_06180 [Synechocystis sp.]